MFLLLELLFGLLYNGQNYDDNYRVFYQGEELKLNDYGCGFGGDYFCVVFVLGWFIVLIIVVWRLLFWFCYGFDNFVLG